MMAALGALIGAVVHGGVGAAAGAVAGYLAASAGINGLRRWTPGSSILIQRAERAEIEKAMHMAMSVTWGLRPVMLAEDYVSRQVAMKVFDLVVEPYTVTVTPHVADLQRHLLTIVQGAQKPEDSLAAVRRAYGKRMFSRNQSNVLAILADRLLEIQSDWGPIAESRVWFERWCDEIGLKGQGEARWREIFGEELMTMDEWKAARRQAAIDSFFADDEAA